MLLNPGPGSRVHQKWRAGLRCKKGEGAFSTALCTYCQQQKVARHRVRPEKRQGSRGGRGARTTAAISAAASRQFHPPAARKADGDVPATSGNPLHPLRLRNRAQSALQRLAARVRSLARHLSAKTEGCAAQSAREAAQQRGKSTWAIGQARAQRNRWGVGWAALRQLIRLI